MDIQTGWLAEHGLWTADDTERVLRAEAVADYCYDYARRHVEAAREVVLSLKERYRLVLVSNFYGNIETILHDFSLDVFETIVESTVVGVRKPDPAIYRLGVEATGVAAEQVVVIGDSFSKDIVPAHAVGCKTIWLKGEGWGGEQEDDSLADVVISDIKDVLIYL